MNCTENDASPYSGKPWSVDTVNIFVPTTVRRFEFMEASMLQKFYRLGCDIGGTFTDFVLLNDQTGELKIYKCLTTPKDPSDAVEHGIREMEKNTPGFVEKMDEVIHGTTLVINSIIERKGAKTGLITTKGFRDVLEIGRGIRYAPYDVFAEFPKPLIPRQFRLEVDERIRSDGTVLKPLDPEEVRQRDPVAPQHGRRIDCCLSHKFF